MSEIELVKWAVFTIMGLALWFFKRNLDDTEKKMAALDIKYTALQLDNQIIRRDYLHRDDFKEFKQELRSMFEEIKSDIRDMKAHEP